MFFRDIVGQSELKERLVQGVKQGRIPHAQLWYGKEGVGKIPLAIAYAQYLCCENKTADDSCGVCPSCLMFQKLVHPDLHFAFPVVKKKGAKSVVCNDYIREWREICLDTPYFGLSHWLRKIKAENQQAIIYTNEGDEIIRKLNVKSSQGSYKVLIIWLPEKMNVECSNKLLKLVEEPAEQTVIIMVSEDINNVLPTILSRTQCLHVSGATEEDIARSLLAQINMDSALANNIAHRAQGSFLKALETVYVDEENKVFFEQFVSLMRLAYMRKVKEMKAWSDKMADMGREKQKRFLVYSQQMIRESFILNFHRKEMSYLNTDEENFTKNFAPFINEQNIMEMMNELSEAQLHIEHNGNAKMVFFDFALKMIVLLVRKNNRK